MKDCVKPFRCREQASLTLLINSEHPQTVFNDDHGTVDDDAKIYSAEAHQVGADLGFDHASDGNQHGKGDDAGRDYCGADVAEEKEQDGDYKQRAFDEVLFDRRDGGFDQRSSVVKRTGYDALR